MDRDQDENLNAELAARSRAIAAQQIGMLFLTQAEAMARLEMQQAQIAELQRRLEEVAKRASGEAGS